MSSSEQTPQSDSALPQTGEISSSAARLIAAIESINEVDVVNAPEADRAAVLELIEIVTDEQRSSLLFALLLERIRTGA
jgi:hypothetical protein